MQRIGRRGSKIELFIIPSRHLIFRVNGECPNACDLGRLRGSQYGVSQECSPNAFLLPVAMNGQASQQHDRHRMAC